MPLPKTKHAYRDVAQTLDTALLAGGARLRCTSHGKAVYWRQRAYKLRSILWKEGPTPYDQMELTLDGQYVIIGFKDTPELTGLDGKPLEVEREFEVDDDLLDAALNLNLEIKK